MLREQLSRLSVWKISVIMGCLGKRQFTFFVLTCFIYLFSDKQIISKSKFSRKVQKFDETFNNLVYVANYETGVNGKENTSIKGQYGTVPQVHFKPNKFFYEYYPELHNEIDIENVGRSRTRVELLLINMGLSKTKIQEINSQQ